MFKTVWYQMPTSQGRIKCGMEDAHQENPMIKIMLIAMNFKPDWLGYIANCYGLNDCLNKAGLGSTTIVFPAHQIQLR